MNKPKIRFKGFEGEWESDIVSNLCKIGTGKSNTQDQVIDGIYPFYIRSEKVAKSNKYLYDCEAVITIGDGNIGRVFHYVNGKFDLHQRCYKMTDFTGINAQFFYRVFSAFFYDRVIKMSAKATVDSVRMDMISDMKINYPTNISEQTKIAEYFGALDSLISLTEKKISSLKQVKQASLHSMFPQEGETTPRVRFKGFSGEWERVKLGEVGTTISGVGFPNKEQNGLYGIPFFKVSDMNTNGNERIMSTSNNYVTEEQIQRNRWKVCYDKAIFFAKVGAAVLLNRKRLVTSPCLCDNNTMLYKFDKETWDPYFCLSLFDNINLASLVQVGSLPSYNGTMIENINVIIPSLAEQTQIANYFSNLDKQIRLQEARLAKLKSVKASCLDLMFV